jgi:hypothetical protein
MFVESTPIYGKWALAQLDKLSPFCRLPLMLLRADRHEKVAFASSLALGDNAGHLSNKGRN